MFRIANNTSQRRPQPDNDCMKPWFYRCLNAHSRQACVLPRTSPQQLFPARFRTLCNFLPPVPRNRAGPPNIPFSRRFSFIPTNYHLLPLLCRYWCQLTPGLSDVARQATGARHTAASSRDSLQGIFQGISPHRKANLAPPGLSESRERGGANALPKTERCEEADLTCRQPLPARQSGATGPRFPRGP
jgi:hypothetical protein